MSLNILFEIYLIAILFFATKLLYLVIKMFVLFIESKQDRERKLSVKTLLPLLFVNNRDIRVTP